MRHANGNGHGTCVECEVDQLARNHYFRGKLLVERDFTDEQRYHLTKQRRHNRVLHGAGVACGLRVKEHPEASCRDEYVVVEPGVAIDCCGREIVVAREHYLKLPERVLADGGTDGKHVLRVRIAYAECATEDVPALFDDCACDDTATQPNRILEAFAIGIQVDPPADEEGTAETDCAAILERALDPCPACDESEAEHAIVLATISDFVPGEPVADAAIDNLDGRQLLPSTALLTDVVRCLLDKPADGGTPTTPTSPSTPTPPTAIVGINWVHNWPDPSTGDEEEDAKLRLEHMTKHGLVVVFSDTIEAADVHSNSVALLTMDSDGVWHELPAKDLSAVRVDPGTGPLGELEEAPSEPNAARLMPADSLDSKTTYRVLVKGDFIRDVNGQAVDADHLPPWLPTATATGDGVAGGTFESWFELPAL